MRAFVLLALSAFVLLHWLPAVRGASILWTGTAGNGLWSDATNFNRSCAPTDADTVILPSGVSISAAYPFVGNLVIPAGTQFNLSGTLQLGDGGVVSNFGEFRVLSTLHGGSASGCVVNLGAGSSFINQLGGIFELEPESQAAQSFAFRGVSTGPSTIQNFGQMLLFGLFSTIPATGVPLALCNEPTGWMLFSPSFGTAGEIYSNGEPLLF